MRAFGYTVARDPAEAVRMAANTANSTFVASGTDLLNLMRDGAEAHDHLIDAERTLSYPAADAGTCPHHWLGMRVELARLHAADECLPLVASEEQFGSVRVLTVTNGDHLGKVRRNLYTLAAVIRRAR